MILYIDTTDFNAVNFTLSRDGKVFSRSFKVDPHQSHETLDFLEKYLSLAKVKKGSVKKIYVNKGPGSFTGTRIGVSHGLALGLGWKVPVRFLAKEKFELELKKAAKI